jgi:preprotein translocase subunit YajC
VNTFSTILAASSSGGSPLGILILVVPFGLLIWLMVVPQRKQRARQQDLLSKLDVGDEVITSGGIVGVITHVEDQIVHLEVDHDVVIRVSKASISRSTEEPDPATATRSRGGLLGGLMGGGAASSSTASSGSGSTKGSDAPARSSAKKK